MQIRAETLSSKIFDAVFFLVPWSVILYAVITSMKPYPNQLDSQIVYWVFVSILTMIWLLILNGALKTRRFEVNKGIVEIYESRFLLCRTHRSYLRDVISMVDVRRGGRGIFSGASFSVVLVLKNEKELLIKNCQTEGEALGLCFKVGEILDGSEA